MGLKAFTECMRGPGVDLRAPFPAVTKVRDCGFGDPRKDAIICFRSICVYVLGTKVVPVRSVRFGYPGDCECFDHDYDGDVDMRDFAEITRGDD